VGFVVYGQVFFDIYTNTEWVRIGSDSRSDPNLCLSHNPRRGWAGVEEGGWSTPPCGWSGEGVRFEILNLLFGLPISTFGNS